MLDSANWHSRRHGRCSDVDKQHFACHIPPGTHIATPRKVAQAEIRAGQWQVHPLVGERHRLPWRSYSRPCHQALGRRTYMHGTRWRKSRPASPSLQHDSSSLTLAALCPGTTFRRQVKWILRFKSITARRPAASFLRQCGAQPPIGGYQPSWSPLLQGLTLFSPPLAVIQPFTAMPSRSTDRTLLTALAGDATDVHFVV